MKGKKAMAINAEKLMANLAPALCLPVTRKTAAAKRATKLPSIRESTARRAPKCAMAWIAGVILLFAPFQQRAQTGQLVRVDGLVFENVQHQKFVRVAEETADQVADLEARRVFAIHLGDVNMSPVVLAVRH